MKTVFLALISVYQKFISPWLGPHCRFSPTCSHLTYEAIKSYGVFVGVAIALKRLLRCHPLYPGGYEPLEKIHG